MRRSTKYFLMMFFCIVILAGESFKIHDINISGVVLVVIVLQLGAMLLIGRGPQVKLQHLSLIAVSIVFLFLGISKYLVGDVFEDFLPFLVFLVIATSLNNLNLQDHIHLYRFVIVVSALCVLKVLAISYFDVDPAWGGNTFWQAGKHELSSGLNRVILKGGDVFICVSSVMVLTSFLLKRHFSSLFARPFVMLLLTALLISVMFSFTRTSVVAIIGAVFCWGLILRKSSAFDKQRILIFSTISVLLFAFFASSNFYQAFVDRSSEDEDNVAAVYRVVETLQALEVASETGYLGSGLGAHFFTPLSGSEKDDGRSLYVHNLPAWLVLKVGILGACLFYLVVVRSITSSTKKIARPQTLSIQAVSLLAVSLSGLFFLLINDLINNKFVTVSGASAYALLVSLGNVNSSRNVRT